MPELRLPFFAHGGDYNPDQWRHIPGTLEEDVRLMKLAHHWVPITDNTLEAGRLIDRLE